MSDRLGNSKNVIEGINGLYANIFVQYINCIFVLAVKSFTR